MSEQREWAAGRQAMITELVDMGAMGARQASRALRAVERGAEFDLGCGQVLRYRASDQRFVIAGTYTPEGR